MTLWQRPATADDINQAHTGTIMDVLDIKITAVEDEALVGTMPVDHRTHQPMGYLHGGASVVLAETLGSVAANLTLASNQAAMGLEINANHIKGVKSGLVTGRAVPLHRGRSTQVWEIRLTDETGDLVCISRLTVAIKTF